MVIFSTACRKALITIMPGILVLQKIKTDLKLKIPNSKILQVYLSYIPWMPESQNKNHVYFLALIVSICLRVLFLYIQVLRVFTPETYIAAQWIASIDQYVVSLGQKLLLWKESAMTVIGRTGFVSNSAQHDIAILVTCM